MRILACLNADLFSCLAINRLLPALAGHDVSIALTQRVGKAGTDTVEPPQRRELRQAEQHIPLELLFPLVERANLPDDGTRLLTFRELTTRRGIPVTALPNPNNEEGLAWVRALAPDLVVSIRYGAIFKSAFLAIPPLGVLNLHSGLLPAYRGVLATFRALANGDTEIGCTVHYIADGTIDTGPIVATTRTPVDRSRSLFWHIAQLYGPGVEALGKAAQRVLRGDALATTAQPGGTYYSYPTHEEWARLAADGWTVVTMADAASVWQRFGATP
ncbi:MAG: formyl transferase [Gemmatimonadetes bacterium]|jgi:methionyl-tRNA formyltransferase|nr:formyl transferase [Gemmatimonadota bacterium]